MKNPSSILTLLGFSYNIICHCHTPPNLTFTPCLFIIGNRFEKAIFHRRLEKVKAQAAKALSCQQNRERQRQPQEKASEGFCVVRRKSNPRANSPCVNVEFLAAEDIRKGRAWPSPLLLFAVNYCAFQRQRQPTYPHRIIFCFPPKSCNGLNDECCDCKKSLSISV